jgi:hypothetical protein
MWIHLLALGLIDGAGGQSGPASESGGGSSEGRKRQPFVSFKPLLKRVMEARAKKLRPPKAVREQVRAIEVQAAQQVLSGSGEEAFRALMRQWQAIAQPRLDAGQQDVDAEQLFMAQIAMRIRAMEYEKRLQEEEDEEVLALLLA